MVYIHKSNITKFFKNLVVFDLYTYHIPELVIIKHNGDEPHKKRPERCFIYNESGDINPSEFSRITSLLLSKSDK